MPDSQTRIQVRSTRKSELIDITDPVRAVVKSRQLAQGVIHLWSLHTTCALTVNEGADPAVAADLVDALARLAPERVDYRHTEGNADAHIKTSLFGPDLTLLIENADLVLGTWQRVFLAEWDGPRRREVAYVIVSA